MPSVSWYGEDFPLEDEVNDFIFDEYLESLDSENMAEIKAARMRLLKAVIGRKQWSRFRALAVKHGADDRAMFEVLNQAFEAKQGRPTGRSSDSSDGPPATAVSSTDDSSSRVIARLEQKGRPDLALIAVKRRESRTA